MARGRRNEEDAPTSGTAPSAGNLDELDKMEASEEAQQHTPSDTDAMGQDKRREVIGHSYGPSKKSQILFFVAVFGIIALIVGGYFAAVAAFDQPEDTYADEAPWSEEAAAQNQPPLDPSNPCGEPGNPPPSDPAFDQSPCAAERGVKPDPKDPQEGVRETGAGGVTDASGESNSDAE